MKSAKMLLLIISVLVVTALTAFAAGEEKKQQTLSGDEFILSTNIEVDKKSGEAVRKFAALNMIDPYTGNATGNANFELTYFGDFATKQATGHSFCSGCHEMADVSFTVAPVEGKTYCNGCHGNPVVPGAHTHVMPASKGNIYFTHTYSHSDQTFARLKKKLGLSQDLPNCVLCHVGAPHIPIKYGDNATNIGVDEGKIQLMLISNPKAQARLKAVKCVETIKATSKDDFDVIHLILDEKQCKK